MPNLRLDIRSTRGGGGGGGANCVKDRRDTEQNSRKQHGRNDIATLYLTALLRKGDRWHLACSMLRRRQNEVHIIISRQCNTGMWSHIAHYFNISRKSLLFFHFRRGKSSQSSPFWGCVWQKQETTREKKRVTKRSSPSISPSLSSMWKAISKLKTSKQRSHNTLNRQWLGWKRLWSCPPYHLSILFAISGFRPRVDETCALLGYYAAYSGNSLPTFRDNRSVPTSTVKKSGPIVYCPERIYWLEDLPIGRPETSGTVTICCVISQQSADLISVSSLRDNGKALLTILFLTMMQFWCSASFWIMYLL